LPSRSRIDRRATYVSTGGLVEGDGAVEGAVVGQGERIEAQALGLVDEIADPAEAVEERELRVNVEVREVSGTEGRHGRSMVARRPVDGRDALRRYQTCTAWGVP
jgi:hypothetical protein